MNDNSLCPISVSESVEASTLSMNGLTEFDEQDILKGLSKIKFPFSCKADQQYARAKRKAESGKRKAG